MAAQRKLLLSVPFAYRLIITILEPLFAVSGALMVFQNPKGYNDIMSREGGEGTPGPTHIYTALGGAWIFIAFVEAVVLRCCNDLRIWKLICMGLLLSDVAFTHSTAQAVGGWSAWADFSSWSANDHVVFWTTAPMILTRVLIILEVGLVTAVETRDKKST